MASLCLPISAFAVTYQMRPAGNTLRGDLASPLKRGNQSVDIMFQHNTHKHVYKQKSHKASQVRWEMYHPTEKTVKAYGSANTAVNYSAYQYAATHSHGSKSAMPYFSSHMPRSKGFRSTAAVTSVSAQNFSLPSGTRMNVYVAGESEEDGNGNYWDDEEEDWLPIPSHSVGDKDYHDGQWWYWNGTGWVQISEVSPVGDIPYLLVLMLLIWKFLPLIKKLYRVRIKQQNA